MHLNNTRTFGLLAGGIFAGLALTSVQGCDDAASDICGPCGTIAGGSLSISGSAELDGFFNATGQLTSAVTQIRGQFNADIRALAEVYGMVDANATIDAAFVDELIATIKADFDANLEGGIKVVYKPAECRANVNVAVEAQAKCEAQADCDVEVNPGEVSVKCEGTCSGSCEGTCSAEASCAVEAPSVACEGKCEGACTVEAGASCEGTCRGECDGECSLQNADGSCAGSCDGMCKGSCELNAAAECSGTCSGKCVLEPGNVMCDAKAECRGQCMGECKGECTGKVTPPSASADCEASAKCEGQASAQASASVECTPPSIDLQYAFAAGVSANARGEFLARIGQLRVRGAAILQGTARLGALINGKVNGEVVFDPAPVVSITAELNNVIKLGVDGELFANVPKGRLLCVIPAMTEAVKALGSVATDAAGTIEGQVKFAGFITGQAG